MSKLIREPHDFDATRPGEISGSASGRLTACYRLNDDAIAQNLCAALPPLSADLIDIAIAAYMADRLAKPLRRSECGRVLRLKLGVRLLDHWQGGLIAQVEEILGFLTEDRWHFDLVARASPRRLSEDIGWLFPSPAPDAVRLFSGGLDSFAGTAAALAAGEAKRISLISGAPSNHHLSAQRQQWGVLKSAHADRVQHLAIGYCLHNGNRIRQNPWRRSRGFLHLALGCATALAAGLRALYLDENGWGALNLPYDDSQLGSDMSRAVHPATLAHTSRLVTNLSGAPFAICNASIYRTKGEMVAAIPANLLRGIALTFSCDRFRLRATGIAQCGVCTSCLLRRQALAVAGRTEWDRSDYKSAAFPNAAAGRPIFWQAARLRQSLAQPKPWAALSREFPDLVSAASAQAELEQSNSQPVQAAFLRLLARHIAEWSHPHGRPLGAAA